MRGHPGPSWSRNSRTSACRTCHHASLDTRAGAYGAERRVRTGGGRGRVGRLAGDPLLLPRTPADRCRRAPCPPRAPWRRHSNRLAPVAADTRRGRRRWTRCAARAPAAPRSWLLARERRSRGSRRCAPLRRGGLRVGPAPRPATGRQVRCPGARVIEICDLGRTGGCMVLRRPPTGHSAGRSVSVGTWGDPNRSGVRSSAFGPAGPARLGRGTRRSRPRRCRGCLSRRGSGLAPSVVVVVLLAGTAGLAFGRGVQPRGYVSGGWGGGRCRAWWRTRWPGSPAKASLAANLLAWLTGGCSATRFRSVGPGPVPAEPGQRAGRAARRARGRGKAAPH